MQILSNNITHILKEKLAGSSFITKFQKERMSKRTNLEA